jgi:hypothetical protein
VTGVGVVLVTGPSRAGVGAMVAELRRRMPSHRFATEATALERPAAVVFVVSAVAPVTESDCALADLATAETAAVIAVVSKIDDHREWRQVLAADRDRFAGHSVRLADVPWVGAAAAPRLGEPRMDELVDLLGAQLRDPALAERNDLCAWESRICRLRERRERLVRRRRLAPPERASAVRAAVAQTRLTLVHTARQRCASLRADLVDDAAGLRRSEIAAFPERVRLRCADLLAGVEADVADCTREVSDGLAATTPAISVADPPTARRGLETRLMTVLGVGFGLGVALVVTRFLTGLAPDLAVAGLLVGGVAGLLTTGWVVRARALLHERAALQVWVGDAVGAVRVAAEARVAIGMLAAEGAMVRVSAAAGADDDADIGRRIEALDVEIRGLVHARQQRIRSR